MKDVKLPLTPARVKELMGLSRKAATHQTAAVALAAKESRTGAKAMTGTGSLTVARGNERVWRALLDPAVLARTIPGCHKLDEVGPNCYRADVSLGVGVIKGRFTASVTLSDLDPPRSAFYPVRPRQDRLELRSEAPVCGWSGRRRHQDRIRLQRRNQRHGRRGWRANA